MSFKEKAPNLNFTLMHFLGALKLFSNFAKQLCLSRKEFEVVLKLTNDSSNAIPLITCFFNHIIH